MDLDRKTVIDFDHGNGGRADAPREHVVNLRVRGQRSIPLKTTIGETPERELECFCVWQNTFHGVSPTAVERGRPPEGSHRAREWTA